VTTTQPAAVVLQKDLARSIRRGHPWIYRNALGRNEAIESGEVVDVFTRDGRRLARGYWDASSAIAVRILESGGPGHRFSAADALVRRRLREALDHRLGGLDLRETNAFRWVHGEADLLPGIHLDVYGDAAVVRFDGEGARAFYAGLEAWLQEAADGRLTLRRFIDRDDRASAAAIDEAEVIEGGVKFGVDLAHGQKGGLFLDQRENRLLVASFAEGMSVLNLFGYTGGFSVHAAMAGAERTDTVDIARPAIEAARRNFERNGLDLEKAGLHAVDAFDFLTGALQRGEEWDVVISDPPSFAPRKDALPAAGNAYLRLHRLAAAVTRPGGLLCAASCSSHIGAEEFVESVEEGALQAGRRWELKELRAAASDHPVIEAFPEGDYLKFAVGRVTL
jgi:23S rRNA (cytosine1962-C5)-methyltransferase